MRFKQMLLALTLFLFSINAFSAQKNTTSSQVGVDLGIGFDLGVGVTAQYKAYSFFLSGDGLAVDYRLDNFYNHRKTVHFYIDLGGFVENHGQNKDDGAGIRLPVGMTFGIERNLEVYLQAVPHFDFSNDEGFGVDGAAGIRYRF
jgi:hypothetical protein